MEEMEALVEYVGYQHVYWNLQILASDTEFAMASTSVSPQTPEEAPICVLGSIHLRSMQPAFSSRDIFVHLFFHRV